ncbi:hypothetical protein ENKNEFLB_02434 [Nocardioides aquaticus]|uniref:T6SS Phospholipase effector Tle1-like catalytic domain-containing protein n=1 Tax=Nocardioides aquaticus TaxID=160826 RepID=A0ABX8EN59_9ACTN|nr:DUF2235 domain-containing protein [Nocardioides aquaticus]QVT80043.1 hypothetical protein ENKNEFLB_02434 [Nocardioides aquaticus]
MTRLVVCCDGTWNTARKAAPTNVVRLHRALAAHGPDGVAQRGHYVEGVGTRPLERLVGGVFGLGLSANVQDAYAFLVEHFEPGDELFLVGFSRGAYTARSLAGLVRNVGVLRREHADRQDEAYALYRDRAEHPSGEVSTEFRARFSHESRVRAVGVWDTVGALGIPLGRLEAVRWVNRRWRFHDTALSRRVDAAFHAVAVDERRRPFVPTLWQDDPAAAAEGRRVEQVWFAGVHCDVGGGYPGHGLSDVALLWMADRLTECGLGLDPDALSPPGVDPDPLGPVHDSRTGVHRLTRPVTRALGAVAPGSELAASSAVERREQDPAYGANLGAYLARPDARVRPVRTRRDDASGQPR